ncbi:MAG: hypothetical protein AAF514_20385, partial [Verrucomicrobiota bacterium]
MFYVDFRWESLNLPSMKDEGQEAKKVDGAEKVSWVAPAWKILSTIDLTKSGMGSSSDGGGDPMTTGS